MKKFFTILALISALALSMSACTEEEVKPADTEVGGGAASEKKF